MLYEVITRDSIPFNEILFLNKDGKAIKAITQTAFSNLVQLDLSNRNYYRNLADEARTAWPWKVKSSNYFDEFFIESIKSYNTGHRNNFV